MESKYVNDKLSSCPLSRSPNIKSQKSVMAEAIEKVHGGRIVSRDDENGVLRMKLVVSKQQLRQMIATVSRGRGNAHHMQSPTLQQLLHALRKKHMKKADTAKGYRSAWRPALQSIPEEL